MVERYFRQVEESLRDGWRKWQMKHEKANERVGGEVEVKLKRWRDRWRGGMVWR